MNTENTIEKTYQKKTQLEHILLRPDTYIGSTEVDSTELWVLREGEDKFTNEKIDYVPGLYKIFDEILVNAADNYQRDNSMDTINVTINKDKNLISVWNNGNGIPIQIHKEYNIYVPELIFGHLLTSSNYDDTAKKVTGGRNGYGAKLTNIFSKKFIVETANKKSKKQFKMVWKDNMSNCSPPEIKENYKGEDYTCITFEPDLSRFGMRELNDDIIALMRKRVYDLAGVISSTVRVSLNDKKIPIKGFSKYVDMYLSKDNDQENLKIQDKTNNNDRWELIISQSDGQFQQVSFVNSICTSGGGTHVTYIMDQITTKIQEVLKKKCKGLNIKPFQVRNHLSIFLNTLIENPAFNSQTKGVLTTKPTQFGSKYEVSEKMLKEIIKSKVLDQIVAHAQAKELTKMEKTLQASKKSRLLGIPKLEDANDAGTRNAENCTLILTEGDSAKALAMAGIEVVGRDKYGVFPLKGKMLNVREAKFKDISKNEEVQNLIKILGLQVKKEYNDVKQLRYGSVMIMTDQDQDGSHIKGLIINFLHHFWPSLVYNNIFVKEFVTPLIKATKGTQEKAFFTMNDYRIWAQTVDVKKWKIKYYKGLGTSTDKEAKEYFSNLTKHIIKFKHINKDDDDSIDLAFNKTKADQRKEWLKTYDSENTVDHNQKQLRYLDFVNKELLQFSYYDNVRSIPSVCDGLKPGQRKILYACFKKDFKKEMKVAQLSGYVAEQSAYHHGETSLAQTIIGMAQNFVGSNNINLLMPNGQFGSRGMGGKDAASARYLHTDMSKITRCVFNADDDHLYKYLEDDGQMVEPEWYLPIIPMVLVNGAEGIGTGWSTYIPCYNPREIAENIRGRIAGKEFLPMKPWFKGYTGTIEPSAKERGFTVSGRYEVLDDDTIRITELPVRVWTRNYKNFLEELLNPKEGEPEIEDMKEYHTNNTVDFVVRMVPGKLQEIMRNEGIEKKFKLASSLSTNNMVLFDSQGKPKKYGNVEEILEEFFNLRITFYNKRKDYLLSKLQRDLELIENKKRFILAVIAEDIKVRNVKKKVLVEELHKKGYKMQKDFCKVKSTKTEKQAALPAQDEESGEGDADAEDDNAVSAKEYNYLLNMPIWSLTYERVEQLKAEYAKKAAELETLMGTEITHMYQNDIDEFLKLLGEVEDYEQKEDQKTRKKKHSKESLLKLAKTKGATGAAKKKTTGTKKKTKVVDSDGDEETEEEGDSDDDFGLALRKTKSNKAEKSEKAEKVPKEKKLKKSASASVKNSQEMEEKEKPTDLPLSQPTAGEKAKVERPRKKKEGKTIVANKENEVLKETKKEKMEEEKEDKPKEKEKEKEKPEEKPLKPKFDIANSILRYLVKSPKAEKPAALNTDTTGTGAGLSLSERIRLRETSGDLQAFNDTYNTIKKSPTKDVAKSILGEGKREAEFDLERPKKKKVKIADSDDESDFDIDELAKAFTDHNSGEAINSRPKRVTTVAKKKLVISDDEKSSRMVSENPSMDKDEEFYL